VIEAVVEDLAVKRDLLAAVDRACGPGTVLATTTSSLPVVDCATAVSRPADVVGLHFFNPVPAMPLVELVASALTGPRAERVAEALCHRLGKRVVRCGDRAGFIVNRLLFPMLNDAVAAVGAGTADADVVDAVLKSGVGLPMGPIRLLDVVGADVALSVQESLCREFGPAELTPAPVLRDLVATGHLGRKARRSVRTHPLLRRAAAS
jgi:3-hydroxybutyryl-CoA dehydrogenase